MTYDEACRAVVAEAKDGYARAYANAGIGMRGEEARVQCLYILNNLSRWRGPLARDVKAVLKATGKVKK